jgi:hypothetical protein
MRFRKLMLAIDFISLHGENRYADDMAVSIVIPSSTITVSVDVSAP